MAGEIAVDKEHKLGRAEARRRLAEVEQKLQERYGIAMRWEGDTAHLSGKGVSGSLSITETQLSIKLKLGILLRPLASKIEDAMQRQLDRALV